MREIDYREAGKVFDQILHGPHEDIDVPESTWQPTKKGIDRAYLQTLAIARRLPIKPYTGETSMKRSSRVKIKDDRVPLNFARFYLPAYQETTFKLYPFSKDALAAVQLYSPTTILRGRHPNQLFFEFYEDQNVLIGKPPLSIKGTVYPYPKADSSQA